MTVPAIQWIVFYLLDNTAFSRWVAKMPTTAKDTQGMSSGIRNTSDDIYEDIYENFYHMALLKLALRQKKTKTAYGKCACIKPDMCHNPGSTA